MTLPRLVTLVATVAVIAVAAIILSAGSSYTVRAEFRDADGLQANFAVKVDGVPVGSVSSVTVTSRYTAMATLTLEPSGAPIGRGATAAIEPSNLLGEKYVALSPGNPRQPLPSGSLIPLARTSTPSELDQVVDAFGPDTRDALAIFLTEEGDALLGRGHDLATTLAWMPSALNSAQRLLGSLSQDDRTLGALIDQSSRIVASTVPQRTQLGALIDTANGALQTLAGRDRQLGSTVTEAPGTVAQIRQTLVALQSAAQPLAPAAAGLLRTAPSLTSALDAVPGFVTAARPTLRTVTATAPSLQRLAGQATPVIERLEPVSARLASTSRAAAPIVNGLNGAGIDSVLGFMEGWARAIQSRDGAGHLFRLEGLVPPTAVTSLLQYVLHGGTSSAARPTSPPQAGQLTPAPTGSGLTGSAAPASGSSPTAGSGATSAGSAGSGSTGSGAAGSVAAGTGSTGTSTTPATSGNPLSSALGSLLGFLLKR